MTQIIDRLHLQLFATQTTTLSSTGNDLSPEMKTYYKTQLLTEAQGELYHDQFAENFDIPSGNGKSIEFRKIHRLAKALKPIDEGVTPAGNKMNVTSFTSAVHQYGDYIPYSDVLDVTAIDPLVMKYTTELASQAARTADTITREVLCGGTSVLFAPNGSTAISARENLTAECKLTPQLVHKAYTELRREDAPMIDGSYVAIIHPEVSHDIMENANWIDWQKYSTPEKIFNGEIGKLYGIRFVESTEAKIFCGADLLAASRKMTVAAYSGIVSGATATYGTASAYQITVDETIDTDSAKALVGREIYLSDTSSNDAHEVAKIKGVTPASKYIYLEAAPTMTPADGDVIYPGEGGFKGCAVYATLFLGKGAYATTKLSGLGLEHIIRPIGYGDDPLNQRGSIGWKMTKTAERLYEERIVRVESGSSYSGDSEAN